MEEQFNWEDDLMTKSFQRQESHLARWTYFVKPRFNESIQTPDWRRLTEPPMASQCLGQHLRHGVWPTKEVSLRKWSISVIKSLSLDTGKTMLPLASTTIHLLVY